MQSVRSGGPAAAADIKTGDLVELGDVKIAGVGDLVAAIAIHEPGARVTVTMKRGSKWLSLAFTLTKQPRVAASG